MVKLVCTLCRGHKCLLSSKCFLLLKCYESDIIYYERFGKVMQMTYIWGNDSYMICCEIGDLQCLHLNTVPPQRLPF